MPSKIIQRTVPIFGIAVPITDLRPKKPTRKKSVVKTLHRMIDVKDPPKRKAAR